MPKLGLMAEQWMQFEKMLKGFPDMQRREMKRAFYAGAQCILFRVIEAFAPEAEPTDADMQVMESVHKELQDFAELIKEGKA